VPEALRASLAPKKGAAAAKPAPEVPVVAATKVRKARGSSGTGEGPREKVT